MGRRLVAFQRAESEPNDDHVDQFFADQVLGALANDFTLVRRALAEAIESGALLSRRRMLQLHRRLAWTFRAEITWFERKLYASLSHESNKAMNINSYLGLMGRSFDPRPGANGGLILLPAANSGSIQIPDADYVLTLDADSVLLPEYCLRLVHLLELPENARVAVAQTPYSAFPGSATRIERMAGGTTDLQHIVHQGMGYHDATFWVGANAVIRKRALDDIGETEIDGEREIRRYVQDRTVIEDTESSLDLAIHGWRLMNYPERLSYSATPPDFGSLSIQRRRWANGGLLILPKLARAGRERTRRGERGSLLQTCLRINYLASTCWSSIGLVFLLAYPFDSKLLQPADPAGRSALLRRDGVRPQTVRVQAHRHPAHLRLQPDPAAGDAGRRAEVAPAGDHRQEDSVRPHAQGGQPDGDGADVHPVPAADHRVLGLFGLARPARSVPSRHRQCDLRLVQRAGHVVRRRRVHRCRAIVVDTWLGLIEHLYVTDRPARVSRRRGHAPAAARRPCTCRGTRCSIAVPRRPPRART